MAIINNKNIPYIRDGFSHFYPDSPSDFTDGPYQAGDFRWKNQRDFSEFVFNETKIAIKSSKDYSNIKAAQQAFEKRATTPEKATEGDMPKDLETKVEQVTQKEAQRREIIKESNEKVRSAIAKQKEIQAKLSATKPKIYVEVKAPETPRLKTESQAQLDDLKDNPSIPNIAAKLKRSIPPSVYKELTEDQVNLIVKKAAYDAIDAANHPEKYVELARQSAILNAVGKDTLVLPKAIGNADITNNIQLGATELSTFQSLQTQFSRKVWSSFDPDLGKTLFVDPGDYQVNLSDTQQPGYTIEFSPEAFSEGYTGFLENNLQFFEQLTDLPLEQFQQEIMSKATGWLDGQITSNFPEAARFFSSPESEAILGRLGVGTTTIELSGSFGTFAIENPGVMPVMNFMGRGFGISFSAGTGQAAGAIAASATVTGESVAVTSGLMASEAFLGGAGAAAATGAAAGSVVPIAGTAIGAVVGAVVGPKVIKLVKDTVSKNKGVVAKLAVAVAGLGIGASIGLSTGIGAITGGIIGGLGGYGVGSLISGGTSGLSTSLSGFGTGVGAVTGAIWATFLAGIGAPILAFLIGFPIVVALILFIINTGAYVVPPGDQAVSSTNPYISVTKEANPSGQLTSPTSITYTVTITAKKDTLTGVTIKPECHAIREIGTIDCPPEHIPDVPESINAGTPFSFTFTLDFGSQYQDSLVSNTITVTAVSPSGGQVSETGSASICFGKCPLECFAFPDQYWPANSDVQNLKSLLTGAASTIAGRHKDFATKVCAEGTVNLCYKPSKLSGGIFGYHEHGGACDIDFNTKVVPYGSEGTLYLLVHEATHHIQTINGYYRSVFEDTVDSAEPSICTYGGSDTDESMAEGSGLYVAKPVIYENAGCVPNYQAKYPRHYNFAKNCLFAASCNP